MKLTLLLTGCINPNCVEQVKVNNPGIRLSMYLNAIQFYLDNTIFDIVFCENSGYHLQCESYLNNDRIEWLSYESTPSSSADCTRGYREMEIIEYAYINSKKITESDVILKCTGRLILYNINQLFTRIPKHDRFISGEWDGVTKWCDTRFLFFDKNFIQFLIEQKECITKKYAFENVTTDAIILALSNGWKFIPSLIPYDIIGIGAGNGNCYERRLQYSFGSKIRMIMRFLKFKVGLLPAKH